ncbi:hypothetical protein NST33_18415 [Paenibacillus sp. FSL L8-0435]|uniref:hypothetical protein n=1 Tax=Paenibacillus sp. FSL L8-0435 TaxID=2954618 RepID=UPI0030DB6A4C
MFTPDEVVEYNNVLYVVDCDTDEYVYLFNENDTQRVNVWGRQDIKNRGDVNVKFEIFRYHRVPVFEV